MLFFYSEIICLSSSTPFDGFGYIYATMTITQLRELLQSTTARIPEVFIIIDKDFILHEIAERESSRYEIIRHIYYNNPSMPTPTNLWLNIAPCAHCVEDLYETFKNREAFPTVHLETLHFNDTDLDILRSRIGCTAKLRKHGFPVVSWNWDTFFEDFAETVHCKDAITDVTTTALYNTTKSSFENFLTLFTDLCSDNEYIQDWCV